MQMTIGTNIKRLRTEKNITQEQLSEAMNVSPAAVSKWERCETYPDITLLQPLAYYFGVTLDELMGYDQKKIQTEIDDTIALYRKYQNRDFKKAREIIVKAYHDYPNDYWIMHLYMWNIGGDMADNDPATLIGHKEEFLAICDKILGGCTEETLRLNAWNMRAKILHAEGKTEEALEIYKTKFTNWYATCGQKTEQLFAKNTAEYYFYMQKNMYELADFAADKLGRTVFFDTSLSMEEKTEKALQIGNLMMNAFAETKQDFFLVIAQSFLGRMENDLLYRGGSDDAVTAVMEQNLTAIAKLTARMKEHPALYEAYACHRPFGETGNFLKWMLDFRLNTKGGRRERLLQNPKYAEILKKYTLE